MLVATMTDRPPRRMFPGIAASAAAVILLEIGLTRLFSYTIWYHFAYLTISIALLGFAASGSVLTAFPRLLDRPGSLCRIALAGSLGTLACLVLIDRVAIDPLAIPTDPSQIGRLALYYVVIAIPFLAGGFLVAGPIQRHARHVGRLYFWDLVGAGLACGLVIPLIWWIGTPRTTASSAVFFALAGVLYAEPERRSREAVVAGIAAVAVLVVAGATEVEPAPSKRIVRFLQEGGARVGFSEWTPVNRVDVIEFEPPRVEGSYVSWGLSPRYSGGAPPHYMIANDGDACAVMYQWDGEPDTLDFLRHHILHAPYVLAERPRVLTIGLGGGLDVLNALLNGAESAVGVELNPAIVELGKERYRAYNGDVLNHPRVEAVAAEGRSFLRSRDDRYDLIVLSGVDTLSALSSGAAYVLSESYLYTSDAMVDYLEHLEPDGMFGMLVGDYYKPPELPPRHAMRLASVVRSALEQRGVDEPASHVVVLASADAFPMTQTLVKPLPFRADEIARLETFARRNGFRFWHRPDRPLDFEVSQILRLDAQELEAFYAEGPLRFDPVSDDSPFFFAFYKWASLFDPATYANVENYRSFATGQIVLVVMLGQSILFAALFVLLPLARAPKDHAGDRRHRIAALGYFTALGAGFILLEISFIQRFVLFLGYPTHSLTVVLFTLLVSAGIGSALTQHVAEPLERRLLPRLAGLLAIVVFYLSGLPAVFDALLGSAFAVRVIAAVALLAPLGLVLGSFFPIGIRILERDSPALVPWGWAVNGCATVVGTILAAMGGMTWSFTTVAVIAATVYALGVSGLALSRPSRVP